MEFTWSNGDWYAQDMGSSNGTRLNESQVPMMAGAIDSYIIAKDSVHLCAAALCGPHAASR
jgi:pSer/pThr/pTyr-binding forkhead associated (FHA) protein